MRRAAEAQLLLLGWFRGERVLLIDLPPDDSVELPPGTGFEELRPLAPRLGAEDAALLAYARGLSLWRARQRHCGVCGSPTVPIRAGHVLLCTNPACATEFFPRLDPAIIVLVSDGARALLGRQASWPPRRYSTIAGFVEPGESLEDAVVREAGGNRRRGQQRALPLVAALALPSSIMPRLFSPARPRQPGAGQRRARGRAGSRANR